MTERALPVTILEPAGIDPDLLDHSLSLRFDLGQFDPRITFTRNSSATYFGSDGLLKTAAANEPRIDYNPLTGESLGLLIEEQRTNLLTYSEQFDNAAWTKVRSFVEPNVLTAPDGTVSADKLVSDATGTGFHALSATLTGSGTVQTYSIFLKRGSLDFAVITLFDGGVNGVRQWFNLNTGAVASSNMFGAGWSKATASIQSVGNGWYRCVFAVNVTGTSFKVIVYPALSADLEFGYLVGDFGYIWGAQLETGAFPTSYIRTEASQVTRAADIAIMTGENFSSWYRADEGTFFSESNCTAEPAVSMIRPILRTSPDGINFSKFNMGTSSYYAYFAGSIDTGTFRPNTIKNSKDAFAFKSDQDPSLAVNGTVQTKTSGAASSVVAQPTEISIGSNGVYHRFSGHIKRVAYYPKRLTNAKLQALTQ